MPHKESSVVLVFNDKAEFALQLRAAKDESYPTHWDFSSAGGIELGENPREAAIRELQEEIGISGDLQAIGEILYIDDQDDDKLYLFRMTHNGPFTLDPTEVDDEKFFPLSEIAKMIQDGEKFHPEFIFVWKRGLIQVR